MSHAEHRERAGETAVRCAVLTISDTRTQATDSSGASIREYLTDAGHSIVEHLIVPDDQATIQEAVERLIRESDAVLCTGGTGISPRDTTIEAVSDLLDRDIPGFGELFRMLSYDEIGAASMLSRARAGVAGDRLIFLLPGSTAAVRLAMEKLILPELPHLVWELKR